MFLVYNFKKWFNRFWRIMKWLVWNGLVIFKNNFFHRFDKFKFSSILCHELNCKFFCLEKYEGNLKMISIDIVYININKTGKRLSTYAINEMLSGRNLNINRKKHSKILFPGTIFNINTLQYANLFEQFIYSKISVRILFFDSFIGRNIFSKKF